MINHVYRLAMFLPMLLLKIYHYLLAIEKNVVVPRRYNSFGWNFL